LIHDQGFEGEYPYFYADEPINGPRLFFSYENSHIAVNHKDAKSFIYCRQQDNKGLAETEIFCGMKLEPKETDDVFSCMFDCGGKSYFSCFTAGTAVSCRAAAKSARLKWLTKEEYAYKHTAAVWNSKGFYIVYFLFGLVLFGAIMTAALMLLAAVLVFAFTGSASDAEECFAATSWVLIFAASGGLYSAVMTACMYIATHK
ncbi:MAG: hypothetical protein LIO37_03255, partial [Clostridiales bacterium]|nr:hypothetical protein [Clostridiales bacterium]